MWHHDATGTRLKLLVFLHDVEAKHAPVIETHSKSQYVGRQRGDQLYSYLAHTRLFIGFINLKLSHVLPNLCFYMLQHASIFPCHVTSTNIETTRSFTCILLQKYASSDESHKC